MIQESAKHEAGANHPRAALDDVEPVVDRREPLSVFRRVFPPRADEDDFERS